MVVINTKKVKNPMTTYRKVLSSLDGSERLTRKNTLLQLKEFLINVIIDNIKNLTML